MDVDMVYLGIEMVTKHVGDVRKGVLGRMAQHGRSDQPRPGISPVVRASRGETGDERGSADQDDLTVRSGDLVQHGASFLVFGCLLGEQHCRICGSRRRTEDVRITSS
jgi:hypothetical protein